MFENLTLSEVSRQFDLPTATVRWLERAERPEVGEPLVLPDDATAERLLVELGVDDADRADTLRARPDPREHPAHWWILDRIYQDHLAGLGKCLPVAGFDGWPVLPASTGAVGMHMTVWLFLALIPHVRRHHAERGIPDENVWTELPLGDPMRAHRAITGVSGLGQFRAWSPAAVLRGAQYRIGHLSFHRGAASLGDGVCGYALGVHIPGDGPLNADACDRSIAAAREFFARHYPEEPIAFFGCHSWLMDPQLAEYLPARSNITRFQRRFRMLPFRPEVDHATADHIILSYVFGKATSEPEIPATLLDELPQETTLQRAYVTHLRDGRHWNERTGWFPA